MNRFFLLLGILAISNKAISRIVYVHHHKPNYKYHIGLLVTHQNDTLRGNLLFNVTFQKTVKIKTNNGEAIKVSFNRIAYMKINGADTNFNNSNFTEFYWKESKKSLYRKLYQGKTKVFYDNSYYVDENIGKYGSTFLIDNGSELQEIRPIFSIKKAFIKYFSHLNNEDINPQRFNNFIEVIKHFEG